MENPLTARGWQLPHISNKLSEDNPRLVATLQAIDGDITDLEGRATAAEAGVASNAEQIATHGGQLSSHTSQLSALNSKTASNDTSLDTLQKAADRIKAAETSLGGKSTPSSVSDQIAAALASFLPTGMGPFPWSLPDLPSGGWVWADGSVLLAATPHTALRTAYINAGFPHGQDGSGNPKLPDMRGRVPAGKDNMGGTAAGRLTSAGSGIDGTTLGAAGGVETHTLTVAQMPSHSHAVTGASASTNGGSADIRSNGVNAGIAPTTSSQGGGQAHNNTQPTLVVNYVVKT